MNVISSLQLNAYSHYPIHPIVKKMSTHMCDLHIYYHAFRQGRVFSKLDILDQERALFWGASLHTLKNHSDTIHSITALLIINKCAMELLECYRNLYYSSQNLCAIWDEEFTGILHSNYSTSNCYKSLSGFTYQKGKKFLTHKAGMIYLLAKNVFAVLWECFKVSMCLKDIHLIINQDPRANFDACTHLVADCATYNKQLNENLDILYSHLEHHAAKIDRFFKVSKCDMTVGALVKHLQGFKEFIAYETQVTAQSFRKTRNLMYHPDVLASFEFSLDFNPSQNTQLFEPVPWNGERLKKSTSLKSSSVKRIQLSQLFHLNLFKNNF